MESQKAQQRLGTGEGWMICINLIDFFLEWPATDQQLPGKVVLSIGMGIVVLLSIPLGYYNLDDNVVVQNAALVVIVISCLGKTENFTSREIYYQGVGAHASK